MSTDVKNYILACQGCQFRKTPRKCPPGKLQEIKVGHPFFRVYADLKGPLLPTKKRGYKYIAVFIDQLTKYVIAVPMKTATAKEFAKVFVKHVILVHGAPHILHTDRGRHFTAEVLTKVTNVFKIKHTFGTAYHPEGQGQVERQMQTIADGLAQYLKAGNERKFNKYLPYVISAMNRVVHATTGYSAYYMLHGREMTMPEDVVTKTNIPDDYGTPDEWVETMKKNLTFAEEVARCNIKDAYEKNAEIYNKKKSEPNFKKVSTVNGQIGTTKLG
ncbi:SCAN domain-containing protein 3-like isoform X2 [Paramacrobiotus metropolitanus]|uniref:SCAN domain-containing protein 3-like isoform X2 n=1 Tax=Paramacrobiotus metropolitanus TaxID=2943436 RepID=UPI002445828C|nr:SCAN domain-containing protein 3-like isoform X2 [Paramacrobiotus metropolitanus]